MTTVEAGIKTFLIADVRGYTRFTQERGDEAAARLATRFAELAREAIEAAGGTLVELRGDEALAVFDSARQALRAAADLQERFVAETVADPSLPLAVGIGLDAGEAVPVDGGYRGGALNLAARLCSLAGPGEVLVSPGVAHLARKVEGLDYVERGAVRLKGLEKPVEVVAVRPEHEDTARDLAFRRALDPALTGPLETRNPYKGLRAFAEDDAEDFFGREALTEHLVARLAETRFLAVVGPSGSGKSSVVRAGLVPRLRQGALPGSERWYIVEMFPGAYPLEELEAALLARRRTTRRPACSSSSRRTSAGSLRAVKQLVVDDESELVLVVDQLEEAFTLVEDEDRRTHFLALLERAVTDPHARLRVVVTLRADFYDRPLLYSGFAELLRDYVEALVPLKAEEFERAIAGPAERVGAKFEPGLLSELVADVSDEPGALPLLQYALTELYERREGSTLTSNAYREIGGVSGALAGRAEEVYDGPRGAGPGGVAPALPPARHARRGRRGHASACRADGARLDGGRPGRARGGDPGVRRVAPALVRPRPAQRDAHDRGRARGAHAGVGPLPTLDRQRPRAGAAAPAARRRDPRVGGGRPRAELPPARQQPRTVRAAGGRVDDRPHRARTRVRRREPGRERARARAPAATEPAAEGAPHRRGRAARARGRRGGARARLPLERPARGSGRAR